MHRHQRGITMIGWLFLLVPIGIVVYAAIRLTPVYLNYMKVVRTLEQVAVDMRGDDSATAARIRDSLEKRLDIESVSFPTVQDIIVRRDGSRWVVQARYEDMAPLFANLSLLVSFDKAVEIE